MGRLVKLWKSKESAESVANLYGEDQERKLPFSTSCRSRDENPRGREHSERHRRSIRICGQWVHRIITNFDLAQYGMRFDPACPAVRHEVGDRLSIAADN